MPKKMSNKEKDTFSSFHHLITLGAFRYGLGRRSYYVGEIIEWLETYWHEIAPETKFTIIKEIEDAVLLDCAGDECDKEAWEKFLEIAHKTVRFQ